MSLPALRVEDGMMIVGRSRGRLWRARWRHFRSRLRCALGHDFSPWTIDDYEGPGEHIYVDGEEVGFMPYCSRDSRPGEFGTRVCRRRCGTTEQRWPLEQAPSLWREKLGL